MPDFRHIDTVLLDMDGTLLDLHFDDQFWLELVPKRFAEKNRLSEAEAKAQIYARYQAVAGQLQWYCVDYWQAQLELPIAELKQELKHLIQLRPDVPPFLKALKAAGKQVVLVTNAHPKSLSLKVEQTQLDSYLDALISTHQFGASKEELSLWRQLQQHLGYDSARTLFVDDTVNLLYVARQAGIGQVLAVKNPNSQKPMNEITEFEAVSDFTQLIPLINTA